MGNIFSDIGLIADDIWNQITVNYPFIKLENFVVMPNHTYGVLIIYKTYSYTFNGLTSGGRITKNMNPMFHDNI